MGLLKNNIKMFLKNYLEIANSKSGYGSGSSNGFGYGYGYGSGSGYIDGYGSGFNAGFSDGSGNGSGLGSGSGFIDGDGYGDNSGYKNIKSINGLNLYFINNIPTLIKVAVPTLAKGYTINKDFTLNPCLIAHCDYYYAHIDTKK